MDIKTPVIIFSVFNLDRSYGENKQAHDRVLELLINNSIPHKELEGVYKGTSEASILVPDTQDNKALINQIAMKHNQESILLLDSNRHAMLSQVANGVSMSLGQLVSSKDRPDSENYSYDALSETYFYTKRG
jgi:hypothetical protein